MNTEKSWPSGMTTEADSNDTTAHPHDGKPRPYSCTQCEKRYSSQQDLSLHMNIHSLRYKCRECGRWCASRGDLAVHNQFSWSLNYARNAATTNINIMLK